MFLLFEFSLGIRANFDNAESAAKWGSAILDLKDAYDKQDEGARKAVALLYEASQAGVQIDLVVRGMCSLRPGLEGISDTIRVSSVIGRFLEHSRLFWFANGGHDEMYIGSADWMARNLDRRVEAVVPIEDPELHGRLLRLINTYLSDNSTAWDMQSDGSFNRRIPDDESIAVQACLIDGWRHGLSNGDDAP